MSLAQEVQKVLNDYWPCEPKRITTRWIERAIVELVERRVAEEREACASIALSSESPGPSRAPCGLTAERIADLIRARGDDATTDTVHAGPAPGTTRGDRGEAAGH